MNRVQSFAYSFLAGLVFLALNSNVSAVDVPWDRGAGTDNWSVASNWVGNFVPEAAFAERAVIGSDDPVALLSGTVTISSTPPTVGGIALGFRERSGMTFVNPEPGPGTLMGSLTISAGTVNSRLTAQAAFGADGRVHVGVDGRGYLTITGGTLNTTRLTVSGEDDSSGPGRSRADLSGTATLMVQNTHNLVPNSINNVVENTATFTRDLVVTGPNVTFQTFGDLTLTDSNSYMANITSPTVHSSLKTNTNALLDGELFISFTGSGAFHSIGQTWDLVDAFGSITEMFDNISPLGNVTVSGGLPGAAYRLQEVLTPLNRTLLQLVCVQIPEPTGAAILLIGSVVVLCQRAKRI